MPEISVIVPVYKAEAFLAACVDSILSQTFSDFEVILVEDGSPDGSGRLCEEYAAQDPRIRVLHQENQGQSAARNHGMEIARGSWICFVDSDDLIHPQTLALLYQGVTNSGAGISMCQMLEAESLTEDFWHSRNAAFELLPMDEATLVKLFDMDAYPGWVACGKLIRRDLVESYPFATGKVYEDNEAVCRWICQGKTLAYTKEQLYFYRTNPSSTTQSSYSVKRLDYLWALESIIRYYESLRYGKLAERFCGLYAGAAVGCCYGAKELLGRPDLARNIKKNAWKLVKKDRFPFTREHKDQMLGSMYPKTATAYWIARGALRTLKEEGIGEVLRKIGKQLRKGERP